MPLSSVISVMHHSRPFNVPADESSQGRSSRAGSSRPYPGGRPEKQPSYLGQMSQNYPGGRGGEQKQPSYLGQTSQNYPGGRRGSDYAAVSQPKPEYPGERRPTRPDGNSGRVNGEFNRLQVSRDISAHVGAHGLTSDPDRLRKISSLEVENSRLERSLRDSSLETRELRNTVTQRESELARLQELCRDQAKLISELQTRNDELSCGNKAPGAGLPPRHPSPARSGILGNLASGISRLAAGAQRFMTPPKYRGGMDYESYYAQLNCGNREISPTRVRVSSAAGSLVEGQCEVIRRSISPVHGASVEVVERPAGQAGTNHGLTSVSPVSGGPDAIINSLPARREVTSVTPASNHSDDETASMLSGSASVSAARSPNFSRLVAQNGLREDLESEIRRIYQIVKSADISPRTLDDAIALIQYPASSCNRDGYSRLTQMDAASRVDMELTDFLGCIPEGTTYAVLINMVQGTACDRNLHPDQFFKLCMIEFLNLQSTVSVPSAHIYNKLRMLFSTT